MKSRNSILLVLLCVALNACALAQSNDSKEAMYDVVAQKMADELPQLRLSDIRLFVKYTAKLTEQGVADAEARRLGMEAMEKGKSLLSREEQRELDQLDQKIFDSYSPEEQSRIERLRVVVSKGQSMSTADFNLLHAQIKKGFRDLPTEDRARLQDLNGKAIRAFLNTQ